MQTYVNASIQAADYEVNVVELKSSHWSGSADETSTDLAASYISKTHHPICRPARERRVKALQCTYKVWRIVWEACGIPPLPIYRAQRSLGGGPQYIQGLHTSPLDQVPWPEHFVQKAREGYCPESVTLLFHPHVLQEKKVGSLAYWRDEVVAGDPQGSRNLSRLLHPPRLL